MRTSHGMPPATNQPTTTLPIQTDKDESSLQLSVPSQNTRAYEILYAMENALRMLIVERLEDVAGPRWYKHRLPGDVLVDYRNARKEERKIKWTQLVPHHPIYYVDFPALKKIIEQTNNWNETFRLIFGRKDIFSASWSTLEPIRNKVAHNRQISQNELTTLIDSYNFLSNLVGECHFRALARQSKIILDIKQRLRDLETEGRQAFKRCKRIVPIQSLPIWKSLSSSWWFDETYLGRNLTPIANYFNAVEEYILLPRNRGSGHKIEKWIKDREIHHLFVQFENLLAELEKE